MELTDDQYRQYRINYLYHFTHVDNIASIRLLGIMSHNRAHNRGHVTRDISNQEVNSIRSRRKAFGKPLHDYVPLYFTPRNPMLYARKDVQDEIVILCLRKELICREGSIFTDGNAANGPTNFFNNIGELDRLDWECIRSDRWDEFPDGRRKRCAEVLVPNFISFYDIRRMVVKKEETLNRLKQALQAVPAERQRLQQLISTEVQPRWFFDD